MVFSAKEHLISLKGKEYLPVQWRLAWFRDVYPHGTIETSMIHLDLDTKIAVFKASVSDGEGGQAAGHGSESARDFGDYIEKAETKAIGRALAGLGFGTQFCGEELDEMPRIVDTPAELVSLATVKRIALEKGLAKDLSSWQDFVTKGLGSWVADKDLTQEQRRKLLEIAAAAEEKK